MKRILLALSALAIGTAVASAADLPAKVYTKAPPPPPPPVLLWNGWYVGLNAGGIWSNNNGVIHNAFPGPCNPGFPACTVVPNASADLAAVSTFSAGFGNQAAFTAGGQFGYNWQFSNAGLIGFETDLNWSGQRRSLLFTNVIAIAPFPDSFAYRAAISKNLDYIGTVRGRLGFLATPQFLLYGTAGLAYGGAHSTTAEAVVDPFFTAVAGVGGGSFSQTRVGWTAGAGAEWMFAPNWSLKAEGLWYDLGNVHYATALNVFCTGVLCAVPGGLAASTTGVTSLHFEGAIARVGVNWHFGGPTVGGY
jgi:outer membrane immunogenic protein